MTDFILVLTTIGPQELAQQLVTDAVAQRVAASGQVIGPITGTYWWKQQMETVQSWLCLFKTRSDLYQEVERVIREHHPDEVPGILAVPVVAGWASYLEWIAQETYTNAPGE
ncbi:MAG TPA: divalent-cation tolerance protein CutA [Ktedonobacteraceae bacterium]|nr:divalent-cation tolerance protein CutA [Ktedonobacteraceae bacterium]